MHIWKYCWECKHDTPQNRLNLKIYPRAIEGFSKNITNNQAKSIWTYSIDAYQFTPMPKMQCTLLTYRFISYKRDRFGS